MELGIEDFNLVVALDVGGCYLACALGVDLDNLGANLVELGNKALEVEYDLGYVLFNARDS